MHPRRWRSAILNPFPTTTRRDIAITWTQFETERSFTERLEQYQQYLPLLLRGALVTLEISVLAMAIAIGFGLFMAVLRVFGSPVVAWPVIAFIEVIRGTPL
jgi:ABC-type amino acid transport system permease subunit